jgi:hypothetical protein
MATQTFGGGKDGSGRRRPRGARPRSLQQAKLFRQFRNSLPVGGPGCPGIQIDSVQLKIFRMAKSQLPAYLKR